MTTPEKTTANNSGVTKSVSGGSRDQFWNPRFWDGVTISAWHKMLASARYRVAPTRLPMFCVISALTLLNSSLAALQRLFYGRRIAQTKLVAPPIFIIGHWRSGTTLLHEYMIRDERFAFSNTYECFAPTHFLVSASMIMPWLKHLMPKKRPMDNMAAGLERPQEDEFAICVLGVNSPYRQVAFPNSGLIDEQYLTLRDVDDSARKRWLDALEYILKALTVAHNKRIVLKSPPHTARVRAILSRFPDAKFIHISRDPYTLFPSTLNLWKKLAATHGLQPPKDSPERTEKVLHDFELMYDAFFQDRDIIPEGALCEISYDQLVAEPVKTLEKIYRELELDGFQANREAFEAFAATQKNYRKNKFELSEEMKRQIRRRWSAYFEHYVQE
ncbi:MAG: sulfotransferase [Planctomycetia bacterium]|nr:sulfotransferase [Planctomycetia bacterium]